VGLQDDLESLAVDRDFSGVAAVSRDGRPLAELARGLADRANRRPITPATRFAIASLSKGFTALTVASLIETGELRFDTTLRTLLPDTLPEVDPEVTIEHLLGHTSGVWDYLDEDELHDIDDYVMGRPVHELAAPTDFLPLLGGHPQRSRPGEAFRYNNGGYVMLSIAVEIAAGRTFYEIVQERVLDPAGMTDTAYCRSDDLPAGAAIGYLENGRTNVLHLPVRGVGDGGAYSTVADLETFWRSLFAGRILPMTAVERLVEPRTEDPREGRRYGLGFWLRPDRATVMLEGMDAGVSCRTAHDRASGVTYVVLANTSSGAWPFVRYLDEALAGIADG
jgi:CubicO group peptidase (beta-lactamase class C family)